jgi:hypothetical protein
VNKHTAIQRIVAGAAVSAALALSGLALSATAGASPYGPDMSSGGNCGSGGGMGSGGGYCDGPVDEFGNQYHCESVYVLGIGGQNCFWRHVG